MVDPNPPTTDFFSLPAVLKRFEDRFAVLQNESVGEIKWPIKNLPENVQIGGTVTLKISTQKVEEDEKYARMRKLLEELIN